MNKAAVIMSGGGSKGAFEAGVVDSLLGTYIDDILVTGGTSTGALIATLVASRDFNVMQKIYRGGVRTRDILYTNLTGIKKIDRLLDTVVNKFLQIPAEVLLIANMLTSRKYLYSFSPLKKMIRDYTDFTSIRNAEIDWFVATTNFENGKAVYFTNWDETPDNDRIIDATLASASQPVFNDVVKIDGVPYVDGGVVDYLPAMAATKAPKWDEVDTVLLVSSNGPEPIGGGIGSLQKRLMRALDMTITTACNENALRNYLEIKAMCDKQGKRLVWVYPEKELAVHDGLRFDPKEMTEAYNHGYELGPRIYRDESYPPFKI